VDLSWNASTSSPAGYNVYRGSASGGPYTKINLSLDAGNYYADGTVQSGQTYYYVTTAVDSSGTESGYSNQVTANVPLIPGKPGRGAISDGVSLARPTARHLPS
jgi:fibronectin type 3 domain-containing protein